MIVRRQRKALFGTIHKESEKFDPVRQALCSVLDLFDVEVPPPEESHASRLVIEQNKELSQGDPSATTLIVFRSPHSSSYTEDAGMIQPYLREILQYGYGEYRRDTGLHNQRYLFIRSDKQFPYSDALRTILESLGISETCSPSKLIPAIARLLMDGPNEPISSLGLKHKIEFHCFPSGAEELQELIFQNPEHRHELLNLLPTISRIPEQEHDGHFIGHPAISGFRLLLGAYACGDIDHESMLSATEAMYEGGDYEKLQQMKDALIRSISKTRGLDLLPENLCTLASYLQGRRILLIEDRLTMEHWDVVLPRLWGSGGRIDPNKTTPDLGGVEVTHLENAREALNLLQTGESINFDIILLDLYSSQPFHSGSHPQEVVPPSVRELAAYLRNLHENQELNEANGFVRTPLPQIVVFSRDSSGSTTRIMLKDLGASDYFFKSSKGDLHKSVFYCSFRNAIISALKESISNSLGLARPHTRNRFDKWLLQFLPEDRPLVLRIMKYFRFYSAMALVRTFNESVQNTCEVASDGRNASCMSLFGSEHLPPNQFVFSYLGRPIKSNPATLSLMSKMDWLRTVQGQQSLNGIQFKNRDGKESKPPWVRFVSYDDLQTELIEEYKAHINPDNEYKLFSNKLCLILVDDVIGSGGQLQNYLWKFINKPPRNKKGIWRKICKALQKGFAEESKDFAIELHVLFAIGIKNERLSEKLKCSLRERIPHVLSSLQSVAICNKGHRSEHCDCDDFIRFRLHIADYTENVNSVCTREGISFSELEELLGRYTCITDPRADEYSCDFEPLGWEKSGGLIATYANTPGNTIPVIWGDGSRWQEDQRWWMPLGEEGQWQPLFERFFNPWAKGEKSERTKDCEDGKCALFPAGISTSSKACKRLRKKD